MIKQFNDEESNPTLFNSLLNSIVSSLIELPVRYEYDQVPLEIIGSLSVCY